MTYTLFTFIETRLFTRLVDRYLGDDEYAALQSALVANPLLGDVIPASGGIRKMRWAGSGRGKRGGVRVIYYPRTRHSELWMLTVYPKNAADRVPVRVLRDIRKEIDGER